MYYTGYDPRTMEKVYVPTNPHEKAMQRALIQYRNPKNYGLVEEALKKAGRTDLIGYDKKCLIRPRTGRSGASYGAAASSGRKDFSGKDSSGRRTSQGSKYSYSTTGTGKKKESGKKKTIRNVHKKTNNK
jgi:hypothetical protein